jgi:hypothetical protein
VIHRGILSGFWWRLYWKVHWLVHGEVKSWSDHSMLLASLWQQSLDSKLLRQQKPTSNQSNSSGKLPIPPPNTHFRLTLIANHFQVHQSVTLSPATSSNLHLFSEKLKASLKHLERNLHRRDYAATNFYYERCCVVCFSCLRRELLITSSEWNLFRFIVCLSHPRDKLWPIKWTKTSDLCRYFMSNIWWTQLSWDCFQFSTNHKTK